MCMQESSSAPAEVSVPLLLTRCSMLAKAVGLLLKKASPLPRLLLLLGPASEGSSMAKDPCDSMLPALCVPAPQTQYST
jgi:hypothetical protein